MPFERHQYITNISIYHQYISGPDLIYISLLIIPCIMYYVTNKETLNLEPFEKILHLRQLSRDWGGGGGINDKFHFRSCGFNFRSMNKYCSNNCNYTWDSISLHLLNARFYYLSHMCVKWRITETAVSLCGLQERHLTLRYYKWII